MTKGLAVEPSPAVTQLQPVKSESLVITIAK